MSPELTPLGHGSSEMAIFYLHLPCKMQNNALETWAMSANVILISNQGCSELCAATQRELSPYIKRQTTLCVLK